MRDQLSSLLHILTHYKRPCLSHNRIKEEGQVYLYTVETLVVSSQAVCLCHTLSCFPAEHSPVLATSAYLFGNSLSWLSVGSGPLFVYVLHPLLPLRPEGYLCVVTTSVSVFSVHSPEAYTGLRPTQP